MSKKITTKRFILDAQRIHGNPKKYSAVKINAKNKKTFWKLYRKTIEKETILKNAGYNVVSIWESDFNA